MQEVGPEPVGRPGDFDGLVPGEQFFQDDSQFEPGQAGTEAEMRPAAEGDMRIRVAADVEVVRVGEPGFVPVGGDVPEGDDVAGTDLLAGDF